MYKLNDDPLLLILVLSELYIELHRIACIHKSAVSKIFEIKKFDMQKWVFRCSNFMTSTDPLFFFNHVSVGVLSGVLFVKAFKNFNYLIIF